jgi:hypothetical protein
MKSLFFLGGLELAKTSAHNFTMADFFLQCINQHGLKKEIV